MATQTFKAAHCEPLVDYEPVVDRDPLADCEPVLNRKPRIESILHLVMLALGIVAFFACLAIVGMILSQLNLISS
jgi:hypothetical protein